MINLHIKNMVPNYLLPIYSIIKQTFGEKINQQQYEALIVLLYESMSNRNIGELLSFFVDKNSAVISAEVDKFWNVNITEYQYIEEQLNKNGLDKWLSSFDFQVVDFYIESDILFVEGQFIDGQIIKTGDLIYSIRNNNLIVSTNMKIVSIESFQKQLNFINLGMTAKIGLAYNILPAIDLFDIIISSQKI